jgi:hypothetical protein
VPLIALIKAVGVEGSGEAVHEVKDGIISLHAVVLPAVAQRG